MIKDDEMTQFMDDVAALVYLKGNKFKSANAKELEEEIKDRLYARGYAVVHKNLMQRKYDKLASEMRQLEIVCPDLKS